MTSAWRAWWALGLAAVVGCGGNNLQTAGGNDPGDEYWVVRLQSQNLQVDLPGRVTGFVQVVDQDGQPVDGLEGGDFQLFENGAVVSEFESGQRTLSNPQNFRSFSHLLIDRSGSVGNNVATAAAIREGAENYVRKLFGSERLNPTGTPPQWGPYDPARLDSTAIRLSWFDGSQDIYPITGFDIGFSSDPNLLIESIQHLFDEPPFNPSTNLYGAVMRGLDVLDDVDTLAIAEGIQNRTLTLVTFTDGTHRAGGNITLQQVGQRIQTVTGGRRKYSAFSIGVGSEIEPNVLSVIGPEGSRTSGSLEDIVERFDDATQLVAKLANSFYVISYRSPKTSGTHQLVIATDRSRRQDDVALSFVADGFGAGAAFLSLRAHPELAGALGGFTFTDALEDSAGRIVACGWRGATCASAGCTGPSQAILARFLPNGTLDESLGLGGVIELETAQSPSGATSIDREADGTLVVGGWMRSVLTSGVSVGRVWKVNPGSGSSFGVSPVALGSGDEVFHDIVVERGVGDPRVYIAGSTTLAGAPVAMLEALRLADLAPPPASAPGSVWTFVDTRGGTVASRAARSIALHGGDGLVTAGDGRSFVPSSVNGGRDVLVTRHFTATGDLDPGFGSGGRVVATEVCATPPPQSTPVFPGLAAALRVDSLGRIVVAGTLFATGGSTPAEQPAVWRFLSNGAPDALAFSGSFNTPFYRSGVVTLRLGTTANGSVDFGRNAAAHGLALGPADQVVLAGQRLNQPGHLDTALISFAANGVPDTYNFVGFAIDDGAIADDSDDRGQVIVRHSNGSLWCLGVSRDRMTQGATDVPIVWIDEETPGLFNQP